MLWRFSLIAAVLAAGWYSFSILSEVDMGDVVAYNNFQKHVGSEPFQAGDLIGISPDGQRMSYVCSMDVDAGALKEASISKAYVNGLDAALPQFTRLVDWVRSLAGVKAENSGLSAAFLPLNFEGRTSAFPQSGAVPPMSPGCACAVAASLIRREQVCTVERSLIESRLVASEGDDRPSRQERTVGVTFRDSNFFIQDIAKLDCANIPATANLEVPQQTGLCSKGPEREYDVVLRHALGVIREQALQN